MNVSIKFDKLNSCQLLKEVVTNVWNSKPLNNCQVADLYRLSRKIELYDDEDIVIERSTSSKYNSYSKLLRIRDIICTLKVLMNENQADILNTLEIFSDTVSKSKENDEMKTLELILSKLPTKHHSLNLCLMKIMTSQTVVYYPYALIKSKLEDQFQVIDKSGNWDIEVKFFRDTIVVTHIKTMKSREESDLIEFVWNFSITFSVQFCHLEKCECEITSIVFSDDTSTNRKLQIVELIKCAIE